MYLPAFPSGVNTWASDVFPKHRPRQFNDDVTTAQVPLEKEAHRAVISGEAMRKIATRRGSRVAVTDTFVYVRAGRPRRSCRDGRAAAGTCYDGADAFASAWVSKAEPTSWWQQVSRWCEPALAQYLLTADPANVPASKVTGPAVEVGGSADEGLRFKVATNAGTLLITLAAIDGRWRVSTVDFQRSRI